MKKIKVVSSVLALSMLVSGVAFAQGNGNGNASKGNSGKGEEMRAKVAETMKDKLAKVDAKRMGVAREFEVAIRNLNSLSARVESRIVRLEAQGANMSASRILLTTAKANIVLAQNEVTNLENLLVATSTSTSTKKSIMAGIRAEAKQAREAVKTAHKSLVQVIVSLKPGQNMASSTKEHGENDNEHSTTSTSTNN